MTRLYLLTAKLGGEEEWVYIDPDDSCPLGEHFDVTCEAIKCVMDRAMTSELWANGEIVLTDQYDNVLHTMDAKT